MPPPPRLKTPFIGNAKFDACLVNWRTWIEYSVNLIAGNGVRISRTAAGNRIDVTVPEIFQIGHVTSAAGASPSAGGGYNYDGVATLFSDPGTSPLTEDTASVSFKNYHDKGFKVGAVVGLIRRADGTYWAIDIDSCSNLV